jgi:hypothetical protein
MSAWDRRELVPGQINVTTSGTLANLANAENGYTRVARVSPGAATMDSVHWGLMSVHGYLDPAGPALGHALVAQDLIDTDPAAGNSWYYFGWWNFNTAADPTSFVGIAWVSDQATGKWVCRINDGTATPSNSLHAYDTVVDRTQTRRLGIVLDGTDHTATFYDNGVAVSTYVPAAVPGEMSLYFGFAMITAAGATGYHKILTGGNPRLLSIVEV